MRCSSIAHYSCPVTFSARRSSASRRAARASSPRGAARRVELASLPGLYHLPLFLRPRRPSRKFEVSVS